MSSSLSLQRDAKDLDEEITPAFGVEPDQFTKDFKPLAAGRPQVLSPPGLGDPSADPLMGQLSVEKSIGSNWVMKSCSLPIPKNLGFVRPRRLLPVGRCPSPTKADVHQVTGGRSGVWGVAMPSLPCWLLIKTRKSAA